MALTDEMVMPVAPAYGNGANSAFGGDSGWWLILLFLFAFNGGWGGGFGGGNAMPFMVNNDVQRGFDQSALIAGISGLNNAVTAGFATAELGRATANTDLLMALNSMQMSQQACCCDTRSAIADLKYTVAQENCADRQAISDGIRDIIASQTASVQLVLDKLCDQEIEQLRTTIVNLQTQLNNANLAASQTAQTAQIIAALTPVVQEVRYESDGRSKRYAYGRTAQHY